MVDVTVDRFLNYNKPIWIRPYYPEHERGNDIFGGEPAPQTCLIGTLKQQKMSDAILLQLRNLEQKNYHEELTPSEKVCAPKFQGAE